MAKGGGQKQKIFPPASPPVFIMMEHTVLLKMREVLGWEEGDSILAPGGSISNM